MHVLCVIIGLGAHMNLDTFDAKILELLQSDASVTNAELGEAVHLSASQCSRRRQGLEEAGVIVRYRAEVDSRRLGYQIEAFSRVTLAKHDDKAVDEFAKFLERQPEIQDAHAITGDADYLLHIRAKSLEDFADFIHRRLLPYRQVQQVRSDVVLKTLKEGGIIRALPDA